MPCLVNDDHCQIMRDEFKLLNKYDPEQLKNFFLRYKFFSTNDLSQVLSFGSRYIRMLKTRTDGTDLIRTKRPSPVPKCVYIVPDIKLEPGWDCAEWWRHYYQLYGIRTLSRITHLNRRTVTKRLRKYNIPTMPRRSKHTTNPCNNYEWLYKHYVELGQTLAMCGKIAGVSKDSISTWLNKFKIQVRTRYAPKVSSSTRTTWDDTTVGEVTSVPTRTD